MGKLHKYDYILYKYEDIVYVGFIVSSRKKMLLVSPELALGLDEWDAEAVFIYPRDIIKKLPKLMTIEQQVEKYYPQMLI